MANQVKRTISISPESDYEIHRLAKMWDIPVSQARERCYHYAAATITPPEGVAKVAILRQAQAKVEMLEAE